MDCHSMKFAPVELSLLPLTPLLALNNRHPVEVGPPLSIATFERMIAMSFFAKGFVDPPAFLLVFDQDAPYDNVNFKWFKARYPRFAYIDRILVDAAARGQGCARALYEDLFAAAAAADHTMVCAEINSDPPNPASDAFHANLRFEIAGEAYLPDRGKTVRYFTRKL
jgi:uncharacterized protein